MIGKSAGPATVDTPETWYADYLKISPFAFHITDSVTEINHVHSD